MDTAVSAASICLSSEAGVLGFKTAPGTQETAAWLHVAVQELLQEAFITLTQLSAIAITAGPGSYTGLRIGMATAKGLCYALRIPLITINTLEVMAHAAATEPTDLLCPMIDARRMEVFTALYTPALQEVMPTQALVLDATSFADALKSSTITFFGDGSKKFHNLLEHPNAFFKNIDTNAKYVAQLAPHYLATRQFSDLAYSEPIYGKAFFTPAPKR